MAAEVALDLVDDFPEFAWSKASGCVINGFSDVVVFDNLCDGFVRC